MALKCWSVPLLACILISVSGTTTVLPESTSDGNEDMTVAVTSLTTDANETFVPTIANDPLVPMSCYHDDSVCDPVGEDITICNYDGDTPTRMFCYDEEPAAEDNTHPVTAECTVVSEHLEENPSICGGQIGKICPRVGPVAGGTHIVIWGLGFLDVGDTVSLGLFECQVLFSNSTLIECVTQQVQGLDIVGATLSMSVPYNTYCTLTQSSMFTYRRNPVIYSVSPLTTTVSGGLPITVSGAYMDAIARPLLNIDAEDSFGTVTYSQVCDVVDSSSWSCPVPVLSQSYPATVSRDPFGSNEAPSFFIGFSLDGVDTYRNLSRLRPEYGMLDVLGDPMVQAHGHGDLAFRPAWPDNQEQITLPGAFYPDQLDVAAYQVTIGLYPDTRPCDVITVDPFLITCTPPSSLPSGQYMVHVHYGNLQASAGYLECDRSPWGNTTFSQAVGGALAALAILIIIIIIIAIIRCYCCKNRGKTKSDAENAGKDKYLLGDYLDPSVDLLHAVDKPLRKWINGCLIPPEKLKEEAVLQEGSVGIISRGTMADGRQQKPAITVTIKSFKEKGAPFRDITSSLEAAMMFRGLHHENILPFLGVAISKNSPKLVYMHAEHGDLKQFLTKIKEVDITPEVKELLQLGLNASEGMEFLADKGVTHGDLAARNCRVDENGVLRICDCAMSQDLYPEDYMFAGEKMAPVPLKWMAIETIEYSLTNEKTDVWSFGVLLWEIMSLGETPYSDLDNNQTLEYLRKGNKLVRPFRSPVPLYTMMTHAWAKDPGRRPTFTVISRKLRSFVTGEFRPSVGDITPVPNEQGKADSNGKSKDTVEMGDLKDATYVNGNPGTYRRKKSVQFGDVVQSELEKSPKGDVSPTQSHSDSGMAEDESDKTSDKESHYENESEKTVDSNKQGLVESKVKEQEEARPEFKPSSPEDASVALYF